jgi:hypothetical protein
VATSRYFEGADLEGRTPMSEFTHRLPHAPWRKPSRNEEEYFQREEFEQRMSAARKRETQRQTEEREQWLTSHRSRCPKCGSRLEEIITEDARADQCPACLGVWLDHETFDRLTHPEEKNTYLTGIFREVILQYTTGRVDPIPHEEG